MLITGSSREVEYNSIDFLGGMDFSERYISELAMLPFKKNVFEAKSINVQKTWMDIVFQSDYLEDQKANLRDLPAEAIWQDTYQRVGFEAKKLEVLVPTIALEMLCNEKYYPLGTYAQKHEGGKLELFRNRTWDLYHEMQDAAMYNGATFNDATTTGKYQSFKSASTKPADVGLPTTITGGSSVDLINLMESAISYLKSSGTKRTRESQIHFIVGSEIYRQYYPVIGVIGVEDFSTPLMKRIFDNKYMGTGVTYTVSQMLGNNMIICDRTMVETVSAQGFNLLLGKGKRYDDEHDTYKSVCGLTSIFLADPEKSLYYTDVLQEAPATRKAMTPNPNLADVNMGDDTPVRNITPSMTTDGVKVKTPAKSVTEK